MLGRRWQNSTDLLRPVCKRLHIWNRKRSGIFAEDGEADFPGHPK
jgi:hypothetical protein